MRTRTKVLIGGVVLSLFIVGYILEVGLVLLVMQCTL